MFGCASDCAPLDWVAMGPHAVWAIVVWGGLLFHGVMLLIFSYANHTERLTQTVTRFLHRLHGSKVYTTLCFLLSIAQCVLFGMRTYTHRISDAEVVVELVAASLYSVDFLVSWGLAFLSGLGEACLFMLGKGAMHSFLVPSAFCLLLYKGSNGRQPWSSFSFVAALQARSSWAQLLVLGNVNLKVFRWRLADTLISTIFVVVFSAMSVMVLENLGDPEILQPYNDEQWTIVSSLYFVFVSISTVGYGDLAPASVLGRIFVVAFLFGGVVWLMLAVGNVVQAVSLQAQGGGYYEPMVRTKHVIITGNPTLQTARDFIAELFHPDHADDAEDLVAVFLLQANHPATADSIQGLVNHLKQRKLFRIAQQVRIFQGSVLNKADLERVSAHLAAAVFVLPNSSCQDPLAEDTENIIRIMAVQRVASASAQLVLLLMKSENQKLLSEAGISGMGLTCLALDQFKMAIVGKSCQVPGFSTFICNLCKSVESAEDVGRDARAVWQQEYDRSVGQELYEVELSPSYALKEATFGEVVIDVLEQTWGMVYAIGLVEVKSDGTKTVLINPGTNYAIKLNDSGVVTLGIFIAPDRDAIVQCEGGMVYLGRRERPRNLMDVALQRAESSNANNKSSGISQRDARLNEALKDLLDPAHVERAKTLVSLASYHQMAATPARPPLKLLAKGGHVLLCCVGAQASENLALGLQHFVRPLRKVPRGAVAAPIVILSSVVPTDWHTIVDLPDVYFLRGSPSSLFDLERACFKTASNVVICNASLKRLVTQSPEPWMVDSEVVCCARLVESQLGRESTAQVITELSAGENHSFLPTPQDLTDLVHGDHDNHPNAVREQSSREREHNSRRPGGSRRRFSAVSISTVGSLFSLSEVKDGRDIFKRTFTLGSKASALMGSSSAEYYRQQRYACGQLFVGTIVTSLVVNTFYNPSLCEMITTMLGTHTTMLKIPKNWVGKSYFEFFDHLLYTEGLMAVGIFRSAAKRAKGSARSKPPTVANSAKNDLDFDTTWMQLDNGSRMTSYVYTAPPAKETAMLSSDRVICFGSSVSLATK